MKTPAPIVQSQRDTQIEDDIQSVVFDAPTQQTDFDDQPPDHYEDDNELPPLPPRYILAKAFIRSRSRNRIHRLFLVK
jgi:hypothetical protein